MASLRGSIVSLLVPLVMGCVQATPPVGARDLDEDLQSAAEQHNQTASEREKLICRRERPTGSHISRRVCRTVAEMEAAREAARRSVQTGVKENPAARGTESP